MELFFFFWGGGVKKNHPVYVLKFQPYLGIATVLLLLVISISSSTLGVAAVARFSEVVESGVVVTSVRLRSRVLMVGLGRETTVRGGIHTCQRIWGEAGEALGDKFKCHQHQSPIPIMTILCFLLEDQAADFKLLEVFGGH